MSEYIPTTDEVRGAYADGQWYARQRMDGTLAEFDRWMAAHDAEVRAEEASHWARAVIDSGKQGERIGAALSSPTNDEVHAAMEAQKEFMLPTSYGAMRAALRAALALREGDVR